MRRALLLLLLLPVLLLGGLWAALQTGLPATLAARFVPGLAIEGLEPGLPFRLRAARLSYGDARGTWLVIEEPAIDLDWRGLLDRRLVATRLAAREVRVARWPESSGEPSAPGPLLPRLPFGLALEEVALPRILLPEAQLSLTGRAALDAAGLRATIAARALEGPGRADLDARFDGTTLQATLVAEDPEGTLAGAPLVARLTLDGPATGAAFTLDARWDGAEAALSGTVARQGEATRIAAQGRLDPAPLLPAEFRPLLSPARVAAEATVTDALAVTLHALRLDAPAGAATARGTAWPEADLAWTLDLPAATPFAAWLPAGWRFDSLAAEGTARGPWSRPVVAARAVPQGFASGVAPLDAALGPAPVLEATLAPDLAGSRVALSGASLTATLEGDLGETLDARLTARLSALPGGVEGEAALDATLRGPRADPAVSLALDAPRLAVAGITAEGLSLRAEIATPLSAPDGTVTGTGTVQGLPLEIDLAARPEAAGARITRGRAAWGPATLELSGLLDPGAPRGEGRARLEVSDLRPFAPLLGQEVAGRLSATAEGDSAAAWRLVLDAPELAVAGQSGRARLALDGQGANAAVEFAARSEAAEITLAGRTPLAFPLEAEVTRFTLAAQGETLRLTAPLRLSFDGRDLALANLQATTGQGGRLSGALRVTGEEQALSGQLSVTGLPLGLARAAAPDLRLRGTLAGEARLSGTVAAPEARVTLRGTGLGADTPDLRALPPGTLAADVTLRNGALDGRATLTAGNALRLEARGGLPAPDRLALTVTGQGDLAVLTAPWLAGGADRVTGRVTVNARAEGSPAAPRLSGGAELRGVSYLNPDTGVRLTDISGRLVLAGDRVTLQGVQGRTGGGGTVVLTGSASPLDPALPVDLRLVARQARYASPDYGEVAFDAELALRGALRQEARLDGRLLVREGELRVPDRLPRTVVTLVPFREVGRTPPARARLERRTARTPVAPAPAFRVALNVRVEAPERLFLRGRGLETEIVGRLDVLGTLAEPEIRGELRGRRGSFALAGRNLALTRAILRFDQGSLVPTLDILATARTANYTINVGFTGPANEPRILLESNPPLPQDEVIARLLFDRATNRLSPFEIVQISEALAQLTGVALPGGGADGLLARIRQFLGLDQLGIGGTGSAQAGRYLLPGVYLGLRQGTDGQTGVGIEAEVTPRLRLEGSAGTAGERIGAIYQFEW